MAKSRGGSHSTAVPGKKSKTDRASTKKTPAENTRFSEPRNPLQLLFDDVLSRKTKRETTLERRKRQAALPATIAPSISPIRVALYVRVSSDRSVRSDLSMPDQEIQLRKYSDQQKYIVVAIYYEPGKSAKSTARKEFKRMIADASCEGTPPFDKILIHSTSRFARSTRDYMVFETLLHQKNVEILSITQSFSKDAGGMVAQRLTNLMDEFHSLRSSVDSTRARRHMINKGYWPGGVAPHGYKRVPCPENPQRSRLEIDDEERTVVQKLYTLAIYGDGTSPPMGIKTMVLLLNKHGYRTRNGSMWSIQGVHRILSHSIYYGEYHWSVNQVEHQFQEKQEVCLLKVPPLVSREHFDRVQEMLERRDPKMGAAKATSSPLLLSGIARCACGASMTLGTGTGKLGKLYRYYVCSSANRGTSPSASDAPATKKCSRPRVAEDALDAVVLEHVKDQVLSKDRLLELLTKLQDREMLVRQRDDGQVPNLRARIAKAEAELSSLFALAKQVPSITDQRPYQNDVTAVSIELRAANQMLSDLLRRSSVCAGDISIDSVDLFRTDMLDVLFGENRAIAKIYLSTIVAVVIVGNNHIDIQGHVNDLVAGVERANQKQLDPDVPGVRRYERRWRESTDSKRWDTALTTLLTRSKEAPSGQRNAKSSKYPYLDQPTIGLPQGATALM